MVPLNNAELKIMLQEHIFVVLFCIVKIIVIILWQQTGLEEDEKNHPMERCLANFVTLNSVTPEIP